MCLTLCARNYWYSGIHQTTQESRLNGYTKDRKVCVNKHKLDLRKNGCYRTSGLGGRSIVVVRQEGR